MINGVGNIYGDPFGERVLEVAVINGEYNFWKS